MAGDPEISVLMVAHNAGRFLAPAVASVLAQEGVELELVVVDNAGTDGSVAALAPDPRLRVVALTENRLHAGGINAGLPHCRGEFVALMDADDVSRPGRLARQRAYLRAHPEFDAAGCFEQEIDADGRPGGFLFCVTDPAQVAAYSRFEMPFPAHSMLFRRRDLVRLPWREEFSWAADFDFMQRAAETLRLACVPEVLYHYRLHAGMVSQTRAAGLLHGAALCRLAAARRRAGRPEDLAGLRDDFAAARAGRMPPAAVYGHHAERFLAEGFEDIALSFARLAWASGRRLAAVGVAWRALWPGSGFGSRWRLALLGPAHALRIRSHPPLRPRGWNLLASHRPRAKPETRG